MTVKRLFVHHFGGRYSGPPLLLSKWRTSETDTMRPAVIWHSTIDLLTVLYYKAIGSATDDLYRDNSKDYNGKFHSGLTVDELRDKWQVLRAYEKRLGQATHSVLTSKIQRG
jgi:hypothetical protein